MAKRFNIKKKNKASTRGRKKSKLFTWRGLLGLGSVAALLSVGYLAQVSAVSSKSYEFRALEKEISGLEDQKDRLELQVAVERSMNVVESKVKEMGMVPADQVDYLMATVPVVAKR